MDIEILIHQKHYLNFLTHMLHIIIHIHFLVFIFSLNTIFNENQNFRTIVS